MKERIFSEDRVNTGRQREIDLLKAYSIIMMIITHCIDDFSTFGEDFLPSVIINDVLAQSVGAQGFMICMGLGIVFSRKASPKIYAQRGVNLLIIGQVLNLIRYGLIYGVAYIATGDPSARAWSFLVFSSDIMEFAGLFFLCMALFEKLKLSPFKIFIVSIAANLVGMLTCARISTGYYAVDQLLGMFIFTETESYFPLLHWMIFPAFGMLFGDILQYVKDKKTFYTVLFVPSIIIWAVYYIIGIGVDQNVFLFYNDWRSFCHVGIVDAVIQLFCNTAVFCICYYISIPLTDKLMRPVNFISKNINRFYCVHSVIIYAVSAVLTFACDGYLLGNGACYLTALIIALVTSLVVWIYDKYMSKRCRAFFGKHTVVWYAAVILLSVAVCVWSAAGVSEFPNLMNDYLE